jgi:hypothetical protein
MRERWHTSLFGEQMRQNMFGQQHANLPPAFPTSLTWHPMASHSPLSSAVASPVGNATPVNETTKKIQIGVAFAMISVSGLAFLGR